MKALFDYTDCPIHSTLNETGLGENQVKWLEPHERRCMKEGEIRLLCSREKTTLENEGTTKKDVIKDMTSSTEERQRLQRCDRAVTSKTHSKSNY